MGRKNRGFTLTELCIVLLMVGIALGLGVPAFSDVVQKRRIEHHSRAILGAINLARTEAVIRGSSVTICPSQMWRTGVAACAGVYTNGWMVFANPNRSVDFEPGADEVLRVFAALPLGYRVMNRDGTVPVGGRINYLADGSAHRPLTLQLCPPDAQGDPLSVVLNIVGRARLQKHWGRCVVPT